MVFSRGLQGTTRMDKLNALVDRHLQLISMEHDYDVQETQKLFSNSALSDKTLESRGVCLLSLSIANMRTGIGGKVYLELTQQQDQLKSHKFRVGDVVQLCSNSNSTKKDTKDDTWQGIVAKLTDSCITVSLRNGTTATDDSDFPSQTFSKYRLNRMASDIQYERMRKTLTTLKDTPDPSSKLSPLSRILCDIDLPILNADTLAYSDLKFHNDSLNDPQKTAIKHCLASTDISL